MSERWEDIKYKTNLVAIGEIFILPKLWRLKVMNELLKTWIEYIDEMKKQGNQESILYKMAVKHVKDTFDYDYN